MRISPGRRTSCTRRARSARAAGQRSPPARMFGGGPMASGSTRSAPDTAGCGRPDTVADSEPGHGRRESCRAQVGRGVLAGRTPGIPLDDRGREQAAALAARLASVPLDAIVTSPVQRCRETADAIAAARNGHPVAVAEDEQFAEVRYGDWTGKPLRQLARDPLWRAVQAHPSAVRFPGT